MSGEPGHRRGAAERGTASVPPPSVAADAPCRQGWCLTLAAPARRRAAGRHREPPSLPAWGRRHSGVLLLRTLTDPRGSPDGRSALAQERYLAPARCRIRHPSREHQLRGGRNNALSEGALFRGKCPHVSQWHMLCRLRGYTRLRADDPIDTGRTRSSPAFGARSR